MRSTNHTTPKEPSHEERMPTWNAWSGVAGRDQRPYPRSSAEFKQVLCNLGPALRYVDWWAVFLTTLSAFLASIAAFLLLVRVLDGRWDFDRVWGRAAIVAALIGANAILHRTFQWAIAKVSAESAIEAGEG